MRTVTVEVTIPDDLREQFEARVRAHGGEEQYVREIVEKDLREAMPHAGMTFAELLSLASGPSPADQLTDEELAEFAEREVSDLRTERRSRSGRAE